MKLPSLSKKIFIVVGGLGFASAGALGAMALQSHAQNRTNLGVIAATNISLKDSSNQIMPSGNFSNRFHIGMFGMHKHDVEASVTAVNGNSITVTGNNGSTYTVDTAKAKVYFVSTSGVTENSNTSIKVGDTVKIMGAIDGNSISAKFLIDGQIPNLSKPVAAGTVSAISGNTITLSGRNGTTYIIDASNAKIYEMNLKVTEQNQQMPISIVQNISLSDIHVGDTLRVEGTLNGTNIVATGILDGKINSIFPHKPIARPAFSSSASASVNSSGNTNSMLRSIGHQLGL